MRILFLGDIVGTPGVALIREALPLWRAREHIDCVIANAENASGGSGLAPRTYRQLKRAGIDLVTLGDHVYKKREIIAVLETDPTVCKPANYPSTAPGAEVAMVTTSRGATVAAFALLGRTFMRPVDCPFRAADRVLE
ncbi:MAG: YmdB family metallophosphoesterase, partial [Gemmataceae bacterium]|nr:YmdB family metallophosphoesterase [Gemmataceae bacterium]